MKHQWQMFFLHSCKTFMKQIYLSIRRMSKAWKPELGRSGQSKAGQTLVNSLLLFSREINRFFSWVQLHIIKTSGFALGLARLKSVVKNLSISGIFPHRKCVFCSGSEVFQTFSRGLFILNLMGMQFIVRSSVSE